MATRIKLISILPAYRQTVDKGSMHQRCAGDMIEYKTCIGRRATRQYIMGCFLAPGENEMDNTGRPLRHGSPTRQDSTIGLASPSCNVPATDEGVASGTYPQTDAPARQPLPSDAMDEALQWVEPLSTQQDVALADDPVAGPGDSTPAVDRGATASTEEPPALTHAARPQISAGTTLEAAPASWMRETRQ
ncbi:hypothetical protein ACVILI_000889 [Mesorhizobium sp. USDA 4775]